MSKYGHLAGGIALLFLIAQVAAGLARSKLGTRFTLVHRAGAVLLICLGAFHGATLFLQVGPPKSTWHLCGTLAVTGAVIALISELSRKRLGSRFLTVHRAAGILALVTAVLHRVLAFI